MLKQLEIGLDEITFLDPGELIGNKKHLVGINRINRYLIGNNVPINRTFNWN